jgi:hypothetical protein
MIEQEVTPDMEIKGTTESQPVSEDTNPLEGFFRANGLDAEEAPIDPFDTNEITPDVPQTQQGQETQKETQDNDEKRYQYWQSEADKARNQNAQMAQRLQALELQSQSPQPTVESAPEEPDRSFPPPPPKPAKPRAYNRAEAMEDSTSESAKYLDEVDDWRDEMDDYNRLHSEYNLALVEEEKAKMQEERDNVMRQQAEAQSRQQQMSQMAGHLRSSYQASDEEIGQFVEIMDKPESVTIDNLFKLFRMQSGNQAAGGPITETNPNESFEQMQRAQQVPTSMGVMPSQGNVQGSTEDNMMDSMVTAYKKQNPWGS